MSELKFACPVCGQHITVDSSTSGGQIECPTCFQKIVVPHAPASQDSKFILSASQVAKPRPASADAAQLGPLRPSSRRSSILGIAVLAAVLCAAGAALFVYRDPILKLARGLAPSGAGAEQPQPTNRVALPHTYPIPTNISWTLDLTNAALPDTAVAGSIHGSGFRCERAILRGGTLSLNQGKSAPWELGISLHLFARQGEELSGKTVEIGPDRAKAPRVVLRWKDEQENQGNQDFYGGYALKVVFGQATNGRMPGKIYLCLPDPAKSFVAGAFEAEIRRPTPPKAPPLGGPRPKN